MNGSKHEWAPGRWRLRVYAGTDERGKEKQISRNFRGNAREADKALRKLVTEFESGKVQPANRTVAYLLDQWLKHLRNTGKARPYTLKGYEYAVESALKPALGSQRLEKLTAHHLDTAYARWLSEGVAPGTVLTYHRHLSAALRQAVKWEWIPRAVTALASPPSPADPDPRAMRPEEVLAIIAEAENHSPVLATAVALAAATGCRRGELCGLRWSDWTPGTLTIARSVTVTGTEFHVNPTKTRRVRRIALDSFAMAVLARRVEEQGKLSVATEIPLVDDPYFLSRRASGDEPCRPHGLTVEFRRVADMLGLPYHFHELRHWAATTSLVSGHDPRTVAGRLGHANPTITMRTYAKFIESADQKVAASLGQALSRPRESERQAIEVE